MTIVISVENLSKTYQLGQIGTGTFAHDLNVWWAKMRGKPNPMLRIGETDHGNRDGEEIWALKDVSFTVEQGEVLGIIGKNGAGKSTLLKILSRVTAPTSGKIKVKGRVASLLEVGTGFHPELTGRENVYLNGAILGMSHKEIERKFDEIVDFSGVEKFIDTPVKRYSSGMYVRLAFAVAAHLDPEILVVDEVLAVGDAEFQKKCLGKMGAVAKEGRTVLFVSHNMGAVRNLCARSVYLSFGQVLRDGLSIDVVNVYLNDIKSKNTIQPTKKNSSFNVFFLSIVIIDKLTGIETEACFLGDSVFLDMQIESSRELDAYLEIKILDEYDYLITSFNTRESGFAVHFEIGMTRLRLVIPFLTLFEGKYHIHGGIVDRNTGERFQKNEKLCSIEVLPKDIRNSGVPFRSSHGKVFIEHSWQVLNIF